MQFIATPRLVAAVCNAGGLGILAGVGIPIDELRRQIREVRALTSRPFGVNLVLHSAIRPPVDTATIPDDIVHCVQSTLNRMRTRLNLPEHTERPPTSSLPKESKPAVTARLASSPRRPSSRPSAVLRSSRR